MPGLIIPNVANLSSLFNSVRLGAFSLLGQRKDAIQRLPDEILSEIFIHTTSLITTAKREPILDEKLMRKTPVVSIYNQSTPFPLSQVCQRWRYIVQHTSSMWRSIAILYPSKCHMYRTQLWLTYAGHQELDILVDQSPDPSEEEIEATLELLLLLGDHQRLSRWSNLDVKLGREAAHLLATQLDQLRYSDSHVLWRTHIWISQPMDDEATDVMWKSLNDIPSMEQIHWRPEGSRLALTPVHTFGPQLQVLKLTIPVPIDLAIRNLEHCLDLRSLNLSLERPTDALSVSLPSINLRSLEDLVVRSDDPLPLFFVHCTFPSLKVIEVDQITAVDCFSVWQMLKRSRCTLQVFTARFPHLPGNTLTEWIKMDILQSLETLCIAGADVTDEVLSALTWPLSTSSPTDRDFAYLPKLEHLGLTHCGPNISSDILIRMLGSRFWPAPERGIIGQIRKTRSELITAIMTVHTKTPQMMQYERTIEDCAKQTKGWDNRRLTIQQA